MTLVSVSSPFTNHNDKRVFYIATFLPKEWPNISHETPDKEKLHNFYVPPTAYRADSYENGLFALEAIRVGR